MTFAFQPNFKKILFWARNCSFEVAWLGSRGDLCIGLKLCERQNKLFVTGCVLSWGETSLGHPKYTNKDKAQIFPNLNTLKV